MVQDADGISMTELNVGFLDLSCEHRQELLCFLYLTDLKSQMRTARWCTGQ